jgi:hypothetical protein
MTDLNTVAPALAAALAKKGYDTLTSVQESILKEAPAEADLLVSAQTGSGKTVAFGIAMAPDLAGRCDRARPRAGAPMALVIAPNARTGTSGAARAGLALRQGRWAASRPAWAAWTHALSAASWSAGCPYRRGHAGPPARPYRTSRAGPVAAERSPSWTKPTRCWTWASRKIWSSFWILLQPNSRHAAVLGDQCPKPIVEAGPKTISATRCGISTDQFRQPARRHRPIMAHLVHAQRARARGHQCAAPITLRRVRWYSAPPARR